MPQSKRRNGRDAKIAQLRRAGAHMLGGTVKRVRTASGRIVICVWSDCERDGDDRIQLRAPNPDWRPGTPNGQQGRWIVRIFCSERHREMYVREQQIHISRRLTG